MSPTNLIELDCIVLSTHLGQESLGRPTVWAVGLAEDGCDRVSTHAHGWSLKFNSPTALSSMMPCVLVFAADIAA